MNSILDIGVAEVRNEHLIRFAIVASKVAISLRRDEGVTIRAPEAAVVQFTKSPSFQEGRAKARGGLR
jgi:hypothetical protein